MAKPDLSIIIVNWNSKDYLMRCIESIRDNTRNLEYEIIVIDSGSFDGCDQALKECCPTVRFIQSEHNLGFGKANNEAFKASLGRSVLFLNPDTEIKGEALQELLHALDYTDGAGIVGARLLNTDRSLQTSCVQAFPTILNQVLDADMLRQRMPKLRLWGMAPLYAPGKAPMEVDVVSGACLMIKRTLFENIGMFSSDFFMYSEEVDLCLKARKTGYKTYFVPTAMVVHHGGGSSDKNDVSAFSSVMMVESRLRYFRKNRSLWYARGYRLAILLASTVRMFLLMPIWLQSRIRGNSPKFKGPFNKWKARLRWALGMEKWVDNYSKIEQGHGP